MKPRLHNRLAATLAALLLCCALGASTAEAQDVPMLLSHQGRILDVNNAPITGVQPLTFTLYEGPQSSTALWTETLQITFDNGFYTATLGRNTAVPEGLFDGSDLYLGIRVGSDTEMTPRLRITTVPYAFKAGVAENAVGDITPNTVSVGGQVVINEQGEWTGAAAGLQGPMGPMGSAGPTGPQGPEGPQGPAGVSPSAGDIAMLLALDPDFADDVAMILAVSYADDLRGAPGAPGLDGMAGAPGAMGPEGPQGPAGPQGPQGVPGTVDTAEAICRSRNGSYGFVKEGVCVIDYDSTSTTTWNTAVTDCISQGGDLCSTAQYYTLRTNDPDLFYNSRAVWTEDFSDNDGGVKSFAIQSNDDPTVNQQYSYGCCLNVTPEPFRSQVREISGVQTTYVHTREDTTWRAASKICHARGSDLCSKSQYVLMRDNNIFTASYRLATREMSDNDGNVYNAIVGSNTADNSSWADRWAFACCTTERPVDNSCPGTQLQNGLCVGTINNQDNANFFQAARACAAEGADVCSKSQMQALRNAGSFTVNSWTNDGADNDNGAVGGLRGSEANNPNPMTNLYGYACCY